MVSFCAVYGCTNKQKNGLRFYSFPKMHKQIICKKKNMLLQNRRKAWYNALNRKDISMNHLDSRRICEKHFVSGSPCDVMDVDNVDWCPSLNLPKTEDEKKKCSSLKRDKRMKKKKKEKDEQTADIHYWAINLEDDHYSDNNDLSISASSCLSVTVASASSSPSILPASSSDTTSTSTSSSPSVPMASSDTSNANQRAVVQLPELANSVSSSPNSTCDFTKEYQLRLEEIYQLRNQLDLLTMAEKTFEKNDEKVRFYTGLTSYKLLKLIQDTIEEPLNAIQVAKSKVTNFQKLLLTLMKLRSNAALKDLGYRFGISIIEASSIYKKVIIILKCAFGSLVLWPDRNVLRTYVPVCFRQCFGNKVTMIIDCFEIASERPSSMKARSQSYTIKYLIGITPQGAISFISKGYGDPVTDDYVTENCGIVDNLIPGDLILADRGFTLKELVAVHQADLQTPAITKEKTQLSPKKVKDTRDLASVRIHVERVIGTVRQTFQILKGPVSINLLRNKYKNERLLDCIVRVCCALTNLCDSKVYS